LPDLTGGNYAYATPNNRPAPFTQRYTNFDGTQSEQPNFGQRDAFIQNINDSMLPYYGGKAQGAPQFDFQSMYRRAGDMVKDGWQNPFSMPARPQQPSLEQQLSQYAPQPQYRPEVSRQSIYAPAPMTPEQQQARTDRAAWEAAGSPGYSAEQQPLSWQDMNQQLGTYDGTGSFGGNVSSTPEYQRYLDIERRNQGAADAAFADWRKTTGSTGAATQPLYRPGVNAPAGPQQYPQTVYQAHGSKSERPLTYNQTTGMYDGTQGWGQYQRPISLSPQEAAGLPTTSGLRPEGNFAPVYRIY
jgi:hypothetical protein